MKSYIPYQFPVPQTKLIIHRAAFHQASLQQQHQSANKHTTITAESSSLPSPKRQKYDRTPVYIKTTDHHPFNSSVSLITPLSISQPLSSIIYNTATIQPVQLLNHVQLYNILSNKQNYNIIATFRSTQPDVILSYQNHTLSIHLSRQLYQRLGIIGMTDDLLYSNKYKHNTYHIISIEFHKITQKQKKRAISCLEKLDDVHMTISITDNLTNMCVDINTLFDNNINDTTNQLKYKTIQSEPNLKQYNNVLAPNQSLIDTVCTIVTKQYTNNNIFNENDILRELYDYIGALRLDMCSTELKDMDINSKLILPLPQLFPSIYDTLSSTTALHEYSINGLISSHYIKQLIQSIQSIVQQQQLQYAIVYVQGCIDTVYSWNNQLHNIDIELSGTNNNSGQNNHYCIIILPNNHYIMYIDVINYDQTH